MFSEYLQYLKRGASRLATLGLCLFIVSCTNNNLQTTYPELDVQSPFGIKWDLNPAEIKAVALQAKASCSVILQFLDEDIERISENAETFLSECLRKSGYRVYIEGDNLFDIDVAEGQKELSFLAIEPSKPFAISYHYNHTTTPSESVRADNQAHSKSLRQQLKTRYGNPVSKGKFSEFSELGYSKSLLPGSPCDFWVTENTGIFLCSQRVLYLDGFEMSLSFIRLDRAVFGKDLFMKIASNRQKLPEHQSILTRENVIPVPFEPSAEDIRFEQMMTGKWLESSRFKNCKQSNLVSLKDRIEQVQDLNAKFADFFSKYQGQQLALYYFENQSALDNRVTGERSNDVSLLFIAEAAKYDSPAALNELGYSQLYCGFGVSQNIPSALVWFEKAANDGDHHAMHSLAKIHLAGLTSASDSAIQARQLLQKCGDGLDGECEALAKRLDDYLARQ